MTVTDIQTKEPVEDPTPSVVILPYRDPVQRALGALGKQAVVAFATAVLLGLADLVAKLATGDQLDARAVGVAVAALVIHAALVALNKYTSASADDGRAA